MASIFTEKKVATKKDVKVKKNFRETQTKDGVQYRYIPGYIRSSFSLSKCHYRKQTMNPFVWHSNMHTTKHIYESAERSTKQKKRWHGLDSPRNFTIKTTLFHSTEDNSFTTVVKLTAKYKYEFLGKKVWHKHHLKTVKCNVKSTNNSYRVHKHSYTFASTRKSSGNLKKNRYYALKKQRA